MTVLLIVLVLLLVFLCFAGKYFFDFTFSSISVASSIRALNAAELSSSQPDSITAAAATIMNKPVCMARLCIFR